MKKRSMTCPSDLPSKNETPPNFNLNCRKICDN